ncbi:MAG TPA: hypothetical protein PKE04_16735 [Clostridia bacterium]|nr:hypothetical protein [Clostridia bacterium]
MIIKEIASSLYPWDLADEGIEAIAEKLTSQAGVNSLYLVGVMHYEKRPLTSLYYTQNPKRKFYAPEDSRVYYKVNMDNFKNTILKPRFSERDFLKDTDWLDVLTKEARRRGLKAGAEISHTFFDTKIAMKEFPDVLQKDISGNPIRQHFCCNNDDVKEYMRALFFDTAQNHDIDFIQTCMMLFHAGSPVQSPWFSQDKVSHEMAALLGVVTGGCFCQHCRQKAIQWNYDWDRIVEDLKALHYMVTATPYNNNDACMELQELLGSNLSTAGLLVEYPSLYQFLEFRMRSITELFKTIYQSLKTLRDIDFRYNNYMGLPELAGLDYRMVAPYLDSVRDSDYTEQRGWPEDHFHYKRGTLLKIRRGIGHDKALLAAFAVRPNATPEIIDESIKQLATVGVDGFSLGHYDGSTANLLQAVTQAMRRYDIQLINS